MAPRPETPDVKASHGQQSAFQDANIPASAEFTAAAFTGSSAMVSEGIHSLVDTGNELQLLLGVHRSKAPAELWHRCCSL
jgi:hypothetical protein